MKLVKKQYRNRANGNWRALRKEQEKFGTISDGGGKRSLAGIYFVLAGDAEKSSAYFPWIESVFPDDVGEPVFLLCWALAAHETGAVEEARQRFHLAMLSNLYLIPYLIGEPIEEIDMWHSSNRDCAEYLYEVEEWFSDIPAEVVPWLEAEYKLKGAAQLRWQYVKTYRALQSEKEIGKRSKLLQDWYEYAEQRVGKSG